LTRAELFLQTKFTFRRGQDHRLPYDARADIATQVRQSFESSLVHLRTTYLDSLILHGPSGARGVSEEDWQAWGAMEALQRTGGARLIGVSNVSIDQLATLFNGVGVKPAFVQNRCYARTGWDREVREFCGTHAVAYQGFSLLTANVRELRQAAVAQIVRRAGRTLPQVVFRFALQLGMFPLTGTSDETHMRADLACFDFELSGEEVRTLEGCGS
jgi:diketogulonate reductase-like aldo/keto reductase